VKNVTDGDQKSRHREQTADLPSLHSVSTTAWAAPQAEVKGTVMADRVLRGSRLGAVSYETDRNHDLAPRRTVRYACAKDHEFEVPFSDDAEVPPTWECRLHGTESKIIDGAEPEQKKAKPPRTHWDMLLERRSIPELEELLNERLETLRSRRSRSA
jgi:hypothetical protein